MKLFGNELFYGLKEIAQNCDLDVSHFQLFEILFANGDGEGLLRNLRFLKLVSKFGDGVLGRLNRLESFRRYFVVIKNDFPLMLDLVRKEAIRNSGSLELIRNYKLLVYQTII